MRCDLNGCCGKWFSGCHAICLLHCTVVDKISTETERRAVSRRQLSFMLWAAALWCVDGQRLWRGAPSSSLHPRGSRAVQRISWNLAPSHAVYSIHCGTRRGPRLAVCWHHASDWHHVSLVQSRDQCLIDWLTELTFYVPPDTK